MCLSDADEGWGKGHERQRAGTEIVLLLATLALQLLGLRPRETPSPINRMLNIPWLAYPTLRAEQGAT